MYRGKLNFRKHKNATKFFSRKISLRFYVDGRKPFYAPRGGNCFFFFFFSQAIVGNSGYNSSVSTGRRVPSKNWDSSHFSKNSKNWRNRRIFLNTKID